MTAPGNGGEMLERVARAIWSSQFDEELPREGSIDRGLAMQMARAAIEAMREPTCGMLSAGSDEIDYSDFAGKLPSDGLAAAWSRMIGEAIAGVQDEYDAAFAAIAALSPAADPHPAATSSRGGQHDAPAALGEG